MEEKEADGIRRIIIIDNSSWWIFFHILWEAKSQYIWTYFILLIPTAAGGIREVGIWLDARRRKHS